MLEKDKSKMNEYFSMLWRIQEGHYETDKAGRILHALELEVRVIFTRPHLYKGGVADRFGFLRVWPEPQPVCYMFPCPGVNWNDVQFGSFAFSQSTSKEIVINHFSTFEFIVGNCNLFWGGQGRRGSFSF